MRIKHLALAVLVVAIILRMARSTLGRLALLCVVMVSSGPVGMIWARRVLDWVDTRRDPHFRERREEITLTLIYIFIVSYMLLLLLCMLLLIPFIS